MRAAKTVRAIVWTACVAALAVPVSGQQPPPPPKPDHMHHRFDDPAKFAKSFDDPARDAWQMPARVIDALGLKAGMSVADIGAGTGYFSVRLAKSTPAVTVYAADIEPAMVEHLRTRAKAEHLPNVVPVLAAADGPNLPKPVDLVLIVDTYHHLPNRVAYFRGSAHVADAGRSCGHRRFSQGLARRAAGRVPFPARTDRSGDDAGRIPAGRQA